MSRVLKVLWSLILKMSRVKVAKKVFSRLSRLLIRTTYSTIKVSCLERILQHQTTVHTVNDEIPQNTTRMLKSQNRDNFSKIHANDFIFYDGFYMPDLTYRTFKGHVGLIYLAQKLGQKLYEEILITFSSGICQFFSFSMKILPCEKSAIGYPLPPPMNALTINAIF